MTVYIGKHVVPAVRLHPGTWSEPLGGSNMNERIRSLPQGLDEIESRLTLSVEEAASLLGLGRSAAYEAARRGELPSRRLGRRVIVPVPALLNWLGIGPQPTAVK